MTMWEVLLFLMTTLMYQGTPCHAIPCNNVATSGVCVNNGTANIDQCSNGSNERPDCNFDCKPGPGRVFFVLDSSSSVDLWFERSKSFVYNIVSRLPYRYDGFHFAVYTYSTRTEMTLASDSFYPREQFLEAINNMQKNKSGPTYTKLALESAHMLIKQIIINSYESIVLFTDGLSTDRKDAIQLAKIIRNYGTYIYVVGVGGDIEQQELLDIASTANHLREVPHVFSWSQTDDFYNMLLTQTINPSCGNCTLQTNSEIILILGTTMSQRNVELAKDTMIKFAGYITVSNADIKIGMVSGGTGVKFDYLPHINNTNCCDSCTLYTCINKAKRGLNEAPNITEILELSAERGFLQGNDAGRKILILFSDGHWQDTQKIRDKIANLNTRNISVATVAIGNDANLDKILYVTPDANLVFYVDKKSKAEKLISLMSRIFHVNCSGD